MAADFSYRRLPNETGWILVSPKVCVDSPDSGIEVLIRAGDGEPAPAARALVERALANIHALVGRAKGYLDCFIDRRRFAEGPEWVVEGGRRPPDTEWNFEGIEAGAPGDAATDLWLQFSLEADLYGRWMVAAQGGDGERAPRMVPGRASLRSGLD